MAGKIVVFANQKGGVGKTTSAANLGAYIAEKGKSVLLIDFDPQGNLSSCFGVSRDAPGIYEVLSKQARLDEVVRKTAIEKLEIVTANINLTGANVELIDQRDREYFLKRILDPLADRWDYIFIDCPPSSDSSR